jgi:membrane fusion protein, multidrug efflux system
MRVVKPLSIHAVFFGTLLVPALVIFSGLWGTGSMARAQDTDQAKEQSQKMVQAQPPARVVISKITLEMVAQSHSSIGTLYYERISHVSSEVPGLVKKIMVRAGDRVEKGAPLVHLDTEILDKEILFHKNQIELASLDIGHKQIIFNRMATLFKKSSISEQAYDDADFFLREALLKRFSAQTTLEKLLIQKRKSVINAPFDGIVLEKNVDSGDWVHQGKPLFDIGSVNDLFVRVPLAETLLKFVTIGQTVPVVVNAYDREMTGTIENISPTADAKTKNIFLKVRIPLLTKVAQNMSATVSIPAGSGEKLYMIPRDALIRFQGNDFVFAVQKKKAVRLAVNGVLFEGDRIGADNAHFTDGMEIVVDGNERLQPGQPVVIAGRQ